MATIFRADNIGSLLRPQELLGARTACREGKLEREKLREIEDRSILKALELQQAAGVQVYTDGEYRREIFFPGTTCGASLNSSPAPRGGSGDDGSVQVVQTVQDAARHRW
jgi:hypothetical protein